VGVEPQYWPGAHGRQVLANAVTTWFAPRGAGLAGRLSARELEVLVELASGANKVIARNLQ
jgi:hypothetical protein